MAQRVGQMVSVYLVMDRSYLERDSPAAAEEMTYQHLVDAADSADWEWIGVAHQQTQAVALGYLLRAQILIDDDYLNEGGPEEAAAAMLVSVRNALKEPTWHSFRVSSEEVKTIDFDDGIPD